MTYDILLKKINQVILNGDAIKRCIACYFIDNIAKIAVDDTAEIAKSCNVSTATIIRFCQSIGLSGLNELKFILKNHNRKSMPLVESYDGRSQAYKRYLNLNRLFAEKVATIFTESLPEFLLKISLDTNVYVFCFNVAYFASKNFVQRMRGMHYRFILESDISSIEWYIDIIRKNDVAIFISLSGENYLLENYANRIAGKCHRVGLLGTATRFQQAVDESYVFVGDSEPLWNIYSLHAQALQQFWDFTYFYFLEKGKSTHE